MFNKTSRSHIDNRPRFVQSDETGSFCVRCGDSFPARRAALGYDRCLACSDEKPKIANMALHKQGYTFSSSIETVSENQYGKH